MAVKSVRHCNCPRCNAVGRSVGAMNYAETKVWDKSGSFSGSGVGIGTGGIGVGVGSGTYSEHGQIASKRAAAFDEPAPFKLPIGAILGVAVFAALAIKAAPDVLGSMMPENYSGQGAAPFQALLQYWPLFAGVGSAVILGMGLHRFFSMTKEEG
jgi:hypothetical protein